MEEQQTRRRFTREFKLESVRVAIEVLIYRWSRDFFLAQELSRLGESADRCRFDTPQLFHAPLRWHGHCASAVRCFNSSSQLSTILISVATPHDSSRVTMTNRSPSVDRCKSGEYQPPVE